METVSMGIVSHHSRSKITVQIHQLPVIVLDCLVRNQFPLDDVCLVGFLVIEEDILVALSHIDQVAFMDAFRKVIINGYNLLRLDGTRFQCAGQHHVRSTGDEDEIRFSKLTIFFHFHNPQHASTPYNRRMMFST